MNNGADSWIYKDHMKGLKRFKAIRDHRRQRAEQGWSCYDFWGADGFILSVIADIAEKFINDGSGHPIKYTESEWNAILIRIAKPLRTYSSDRFIEDRDEAIRVHDEAKDALHLFAENFSDFWD